ncbi:hypothetical protein VTL71DRAFT_2458, partial [Oculimacula yallundae]
MSPNYFGKLHNISLTLATTTIFQPPFVFTASTIPQPPHWTPLSTTLRRFTSHIHAPEILKKELRLSSSSHPTMKGNAKA